MMKLVNRRLICIIFIFSVFCSLNAGSGELTLDTIQNYKDWGWVALVIQNEYITVAIVPEMGGNILQYDFEIDTFLLLEPETFGESYASGSGISPFDEGSWGFGGLETWPTPEAWPPPPNLTYRNYSYLVESCNADSIVIFLKSEKEIETFPGLQFERKISVYNHSTRVKIENKVINLNPASVEYGIMNVSYAQGEHKGHDDFGNFCLNFPLNSESIFTGGVYFRNISEGFLGQINPEIYSIEYRPSQGKIFADVKEGWSSFVDKLDSQAYVKTFDVFEGEDYPDNGARYEVYVSADPHFLAMEVISPIKLLPANGGSYSFVDNLFSTKLNKTIVKATHAGASIQRLSFDSITSSIDGTFGVFYKGEAHFAYYDIDHKLLSVENNFLVDPDTNISIHEIINLPPKTNFIALEVYNSCNKSIDVLDEIDFSAKEISGISQPEGEESKAFLVKNKILKNNELLNIQVINLINEYITIDLFDATGKKVSTIYRGEIKESVFNDYYQLKNMNQGLYIVTLSYKSKIFCEKIVICQ
jgi:hypothetical protein